MDGARKPEKDVQQRRRETKRCATTSMNDMEQHLKSVVAVVDEREKGRQYMGCAMDEILDGDNVLGLVVSQVDRMTLVACKFVARRWNRAVEHNRVLHGCRRLDQKSCAVRMMGHACHASDGCPCAYGPADCWENYMCTACGRASLSVFKWASSMGGLDTSLRRCSLATIAAWTGRIDVLDWLADGHGCEPHCGLFAAAAHKGHVGVLDWAVKRGCMTIEQEQCFYVGNSNLVGGGRLDALQWMHARGMKLTRAMVDNAAYSRNEPLFAWLYEQGCRPTDVPIERFLSRCSRAATEENVSALARMLDRECLVSSMARSLAVLLGDLDVVRLLFVQTLMEDRTPWIQEANGQGQSAIAAWLASPP